MADRPGGSARAPARCLREPHRGGARSGSPEGRGDCEGYPYHVPIYERQLASLRGASAELTAAARTFAVLLLDDGLSGVLGMLGALGHSNRYSDVAIRYRVTAEVVDLESGEIREEIPLNRPGPREGLPRRLVDVFKRALNRVGRPELRA